ncbi:hypothetical protein AURDEDRAFT_170326 [Auricularia subglabra TFB-10046 SS5]|nr:hypothetical protein AURDEDRAFT_170326 [Auricularia subglabra TFB-10046 SS5]
MPAPVTIVCPDDDECSILEPPLVAQGRLAQSVRTAMFVASEYILPRDTGNSATSLSALATLCTDLHSLSVSLVDMSHLPLRDLDLLRKAEAFRNLRQLRLYPGSLYTGQLSSNFLITLIGCMPNLRRLLIHAPQAFELQPETSIAQCNGLQLEEYFCSHPTLLASKEIISSSGPTIRVLRTALDVSSPYHGADFAASLQSLSSLRTLLLNIFPDNDRNVLSHFRNQLKAAFKCLTRLTSLTIGIYLTDECGIFDELLHDSPMALRSLCLRPSDEVSLTDKTEEWLKGLPERHRTLTRLRTLSVWATHELINATGRPRLVLFRQAVEAQLGPRRIAFEFAV